MSRNLDSMGWTKVFIDVRKDIPTPGLRLPWKTSSRKKWCAFLQTLARRREDSSSGTVAIQSKELAKFMTKSDSVNVPLGHTVMVANSKSKFYSRLNANGRPVMNQLAKELLEEVASFQVLE